MLVVSILQVFKCSKVRSCHVQVSASSQISCFLFRHSGFFRVLTDDGGSDCDFFLTQFKHRQVSGVCGGYWILNIT